MPKHPDALPKSTEELDLMRLLSQRPSSTQREISEQLGLSVGKANYLVRALLDKGWVKVQNFRHSNNKLAYVYLITPSGVAERLRQTKLFIAHKKREYEALEQEYRSLQGVIPDE